MIAFASLFLGLVLGPQTVALLVGPEVVRVTVAVDGRSCLALQAEPWSGICDLGPELRPRELVAVAFDAAGREVGRSIQRINLPRPPAEVELLVERTGDGRSFLRLAWQSLSAESPKSVVVTFDGVALAVPDATRIELPSHDLSTLHLVRAELEFDNYLAAGGELVFGGLYAEQATTDLTAVVLAMPPDRPRSERDLAAATVASLLTAGGAPVTVAAVEEGGGEAILVLDSRVREKLTGLAHLRGRALTGGSGSGAITLPGGDRQTQSVGTAAQRFRMRLPDGQTLRLLWPFPVDREIAGRSFQFFPPSPAFGEKDGGLLWLMTQLRLPEVGSGPPHLADAVAVAGLLAASRERRRAVVLVTGDASADSSQLSPAAARDYLRALGVPFFVWRLGRDQRSAEPWAPVVAIGSDYALERAVKELGREIARQRVVWLEGRHLPTSLAVAENSLGLALAGST